MVMPPTLRRMNGVPTIPDILSALELVRNGSVDDLARVHHVFPEDRGKVACEVGVDRRGRTRLAFEHGVVTVLECRRGALR